MQLFVYSSIGVCGEGGGGVLCFIVRFIQTCVGITTRTVLWPLGAMVGVQVTNVDVTNVLPRQLFACL